MAGSDNLLQPKGSFCTSQSRVILWFQSLNLIFFFFSKTHPLQNHIQYSDIGWWLYPVFALHFHRLENCLGVSNSIPRVHRFTARALSSTISWSSTATGTRHFLEAWFLQRERENSALWSHFSLLRVGLCLECWSQRRKLHPSPLKPCLLQGSALQSPQRSNAGRVFLGSRCA